MIDKLIKCNRCGGDCCYEYEAAENIKTYSCMGCGFLSNSLMKEGEEFLVEQLQTLPELYKDLLFTDKNGLKWFPSTVNIQELGMVFVQGTNKIDWGWAAARSVVVKEDEKEKYPIPGRKGEFYKMRVDMSTLKHFGQLGYQDALSYIKVIPE